MTTEHDDFDDPALAALLRKWGQAVRRSPNLFQAPRDLTALHGALDRVDAELQARAPGLLERLKSATEAAARSAGDWIAERVDEAQRATTPLLRGARLALAHEGTLRGAHETRFRSGDRVVIHWSPEREATVFVAMLTSALVLVPVSSQAKTCAPGPSRLGPYRLDQSTGTESFVMLASATPRTADDFRTIIDEAARTARANVASHEATLEGALSALRGHAELEVQALTFVHES